MTDRTCTKGFTPAWLGSELTRRDCALTFGSLCYPKDFLCCVPVN